jgi:hypothetical protein
MDHILEIDVGADWMCEEPVQDFAVSVIHVSFLLVTPEALPEGAKLWFAQDQPHAAMHRRALSIAAAIAAV